jgi:hypothetical protein
MAEVASFFIVYMDVLPIEGGFEHVGKQFGLKIPFTLRSIRLP